MKIVAARHRVKSKRTSVLKKLIVDPDSKLLAFLPALLPAQNVDMTGHMVHVSRVGTKRRKSVRGKRGALWFVRHLESVNV